MINIIKHKVPLQFKITCIGAMVKVKSHYYRFASHSFEGIDVKSNINLKLVDIKNVTHGIRYLISILLPVNRIYLKSE